MFQFQVDSSIEVDESYSLKAEKDIKELRLQVVLDIYFQFSCNLKEV